MPKTISNAAASSCSCLGPSASLLSRRSIPNGEPAGEEVVVVVVGETPKGKMGKKVTTRWKEHWWKGQLVSPVRPGLAGTGTGMGISCSAAAFPWV